MKVKIEDISEQNVNDIPFPCRNCIYWEYPELFGKVDPLQAFGYKRRWFIKALERFGVCGKILYADEVPVAYAQFAPAYMLPQTKNYNCKSIEKAESDVIFLSCLFVCKPEYRGKGLGSKLLENIVSDLRFRGFREIETFAKEGSANNPSGPLNFYVKHSFQVKEKLHQSFVLVHLKL